MLLRWQHIFQTLFVPAATRKREKPEVNYWSYTLIFAFPRRKKPFLSAYRSFETE